MRHIRGRHAVVGVLESTAGGMIVGAIIQKSLWLWFAAILVGATAVMLDRFNIDDEERELERETDDKQNTLRS